MTTYVLITLLVLAGPFILSFDKKVAYFRSWKPLAAAIVPVSAVYIIWDIIVTERGHWSFSPSYSGKVTIFGLPLGEWLFFLVVPYSCIFIYEVVRAYFPGRVYRRGEKKTPVLTKAAGWGAAVLLLAAALLFRSREYTFLALLSVSLWLAAALVFQPRLLREIHTLWYFLLSLAAFMIVNGVLTGLPIVLYSSEVIWNIRVITIPLEDFFYNTSMLGFYLLLYVGWKDRMVPGWREIV
jgi:lycopene cyclase domain-containing protein